MSSNELKPDVGMLSTGGEGEEIDLLELFTALLHCWKSILLAIAGGVVLAAVYTTQFVTPLYEATSKIYVLNPKDSAINLSDLQIGTYLTNDYQEVFKTWEVHEQVRKNLGLDYTYKQLQSMIRVYNPSNTRVLQVTATSPSAVEAASLANEYARVAQTYIYETMQTAEPSIMSVALQPVRPSSPSLTRNITLGALLSLLLSCGIVMVRFVVNDRIQTAEDITKYTGLPTLAMIPIQKEPRERRERRFRDKHTETVESIRSKKGTKAL